MIPHYIAYNMLFADLLHRFVYIEDAPYILFPIFIPFLIWQISRHFFKGNQAFVPPAVFLLSPWFWYLVVAHSFYIFLFFLILCTVYGILITRSGRTLPGGIIVCLAGSTIIYSSSLFLVLLPVSLVILSIAKVLNFKQFKLTLIVLTILTIPLVLFLARNRTNFKNSLSLEVRVFSDPGLTNTVNRYQGAAAENGFRNLAKISENKYLFYSEYFTLKYINQIIPVTFFTPQYKLLGFSFEPPILFGFLIPFLFGLYKLLEKHDARKIIFASTLLVVPSILSNEPVALNRLILFSPVVVILASFGLIYLFKLKSDKTIKTFFVLFVVLILFQLSVTLPDINNREGKRFEQYFGPKYQLVEP